MFPPQSGLSYSTWLCVEKFSEPRTDPHPVRLLTLIRNMQSTREHLVCLAVVLSARDRALTISTQETPISMSMLYNNLWCLIFMFHNLYTFNYIFSQC